MRSCRVEVLLRLCPLPAARTNQSSLNLHTRSEQKRLPQGPPYTLGACTFFPEYPDGLPEGTCQGQYENSLSGILSSKADLRGRAPRPPEGYFGILAPAPPPLAEPDWPNSLVFVGIPCPLLFRLTPEAAPPLAAELLTHGEASNLPQRSIGDRCRLPLGQRLLWLCH